MGERSAIEILEYNITLLEDMGHLTELTLIHFRDRLGLVVRQAYKEGGPTPRLAGLVGRFNTVLASFPSRPGSQVRPLSVPGYDLVVPPALIPRDDPVQARNRFCYEQCMAGMLHSAIADRIRSDHPDWPPLSRPGVSDRARAYARRQSPPLPPPPRRRRDPRAKDS